MHSKPEEPARTGQFDRSISDYAFLGDCHGAALVASDGAVDWCCLERFDADAALGRILDRGAGSYFQIAPEGEALVRRRYLPATNILETTIETTGGRARILDFMPVCRTPDAAPDDFTALLAPHWLVRIVEGLEGRVPMMARYRPRCAFGAGAPAIAVGAGRVDAEGCPLLAADVPFVVEGDEAVSGFDAAAGNGCASCSGPTRRPARRSLLPPTTGSPARRCSGISGAAASPIAGPTARR
jgi:hypothetical protein